MFRTPTPLLSRRAFVVASATLATAAAGLAPVSATAQGSASVELFRAIDLDNARVVQDLLARGLDANTPDDKGQVPLYVALRAEADKVTKVLLDWPATDIDRANAVGETALMMAALRGRDDWARQLLARGARVNRDGWTPLHYAVSAPSTAVARLLLERGADVNARAPNASTPLMVAVQHGPEEAALLLLERGADLALRDARGRNAVDLATQVGRDAMAALLRARLSATKP